MGFQCVPQSVGFARSPKSGQKNRAHGLKFCRELCEERETTSTSIDRSRSHENVYFGIQNGQQLWDTLEADADNYRSEYTDKNGKQRSRKLPKQSVMGISVIINPPSEVADTWDLKKHGEFHRDATDVLAEIEPRLFRHENIRTQAHHFDEGKPGCGADVHTVYQPIDFDGKFCGSLYDAKLRQRMAREFATKMRERGWEVDDPDLTDWDRYSVDAEYRAERDAKRKQQGLAQKEYQAVQEAKAELEQVQQDANKAKRERHAYIHGWKAKDGVFHPGAKQVQRERDKARKEAEQIRQEAEAEAEQIKQQAKAEADKMHQQAAREMKQARDEAARVKREREKLEQVREGLAEAWASMTERFLQSQFSMGARLVVERLINAISRRNAQAAAHEAATLREHMEAAGSTFVKPIGDFEQLAADTFNDLVPATVELEAPDVSHTASQSKGIGSLGL